VRRFDTTTDSGRRTGAQIAADAVARGEVIVLPTDTVYGVGADAFNRTAVAAVLAAKGRGRDMPPPVLVPHVRALDGLAAEVPIWARELVAAFWPGPLTLVCRAQPSLDWDLGDTHGTVALRMPLHRVALAVLEKTGPLAVTSANRTGSPAATTCDEAVAALGDAVSIYLDAGPSPSSVASTIIDVTGDVPRVLRAGPLEPDRLLSVVPDLRLFVPEG
jgi:tRNA threonylcarbamoyl adenosine modification protein (Sua5/YciO/YrdC/YwlC family)